MYVSICSNQLCAFIHHCPRTRIMDILRRGFWLFWCMLLTFLIKPTILCSLPHRDPNVVAWLLGGTFLPAKYGALGHFARICNLAKLISSPSPFCQKKSMNEIGPLSLIHLRLPWIGWRSTNQIGFAKCLIHQYYGCVVKVLKIHTNYT